MSATSAVTRQELKDLWIGGRGMPLMLGYTLLLSVTGYLVASNRELNFLEQREGVNLTLQMSVAVAALLVLLAAADAISGERERGTLEALLLTPAPRLALLTGKAIAALSLWLVAYLISIPYLVYLAKGTGVAARALLSGLAVGLLVAAFLCGLGLTVSVLCRANRVALAVSLFVLLAAFAPTQLPTGAQHGWFGSGLRRADPITAGLHYLGELVVQGHDPADDLLWLAGPAVGAAAMALAAAIAGRRLRLLAGDRS